MGGQSSQHQKTGPTEQTGAPRLGDAQFCCTDTALAVVGRAQAKPFRIRGEREEG